MECFENDGILLERCDGQKAVLPLKGKPGTHLFIPELIGVVLQYPVTVQRQDGIFGGDDDDDRELSSDLLQRGCRDSFGACLGGKKLTLCLGHSASLYSRMIYFFLWERTQYPLVGEACL